MLRATQEAVETLIAASASNWEKDCRQKVRYLLSVLAATPSGQELRTKIFDPSVLDDLRRLSREM
jgi:hypothetical protein